MKFIRQVKWVMGRTTVARFLISIELLIGLLVCYICANVLFSIDVKDRYCERYSNVICVDTGDPDQVAYAEAHGKLFPNWIKLYCDENYSLSVNSKEFYDSIPLELSEGEWFNMENTTADFVAVVSYSLKDELLCGEEYRLNFVELGERRVYISGVLNSDVTLGNSGGAAFDDANSAVVLLCDRRGRLVEPNEADSFAYAMLDTVNEAELAEMGLESVGMRKEHDDKANRLSLALPLMFTVILFVLFTVAFLGEHFLTQLERQMLYAVQFMCGASASRAFVLQVCADVVWLAVPVLLSLAAVFALGIRLHWWGVLAPVCYLIIGIGIITAVSARSFSKQSPVEMIRRRYYS